MHAARAPKGVGSEGVLKFAATTSIDVHCLDTDWIPDIRADCQFNDL